MDLTYLALLAYFYTPYDIRVNYVFMVNMEEDRFIICNSRTVKPGELFVMTEGRARNFMQDMSHHKIAVHTYLAKGEIVPWS